MNVTTPRPNFLIIGAQKSGTTSLARYLASHPQIFMPPEKETDFWSDKYGKGVDWYLNEFFSVAKDNQVWGEASVSYMVAHDVPTRIRAHHADIRLIAVLRDPIARALSHYRMSKRRGLIDADFSEVVRELIASPSPPSGRVDDERGFLEHGRYAQQLGEFYRCFGSDQIRVVFTEDLEATGGEVTRELFQFLGVDDSHPVPNLAVRYNVGGQARVKDMKKTRWYGTSRRLARALLPSRIRRTVGFWLDTEWNVRTEPASSMSVETRALLGDYYEQDIRSLESLIDRETPWRLSS